MLESRAGNAPLARELFKAALKVDPKNESTWSTWIKMEEDLGRLDAANELRIRRSEQQWEFVIPASFSTRPLGVDSTDGTSSSNSRGAGLLQGLLNTLNSFFSARGAGEQQRGAAAGRSSSSYGSSSNGSGASSSSGGGDQQLMRDLLPSDFRSDLTLEDIIKESSSRDNSSMPAGTETSSSSSPGASSSSRSDASGLDIPQWDRVAAAAADVAANHSSDSNDISRRNSSISSSNSSASNEVFRRTRQHDLGDRAKGLQQRPQRPAQQQEQ